MTEGYDYDVLVIGAGPGGYACAIRAAQLGLKTACVDARDTLGGTCLNVGCIPSKALLHATHLFEAARGGHMACFGIRTGDVHIDLEKLMEKKNETVSSFAKGIDFLFRKNGVTRLEGQASFVASDIIEVGGKNVRAKSAVIATGSSPSSLPGIQIENGRGMIVDSTGALSLTRIPNHLLVVGGGVIGLELGSVWRRLGARVTVIEYTDQILPGMDCDVRSVMAKLLAKQGMNIVVSSSVTGVEINGQKVSVAVKDPSGIKTIEVDTVLVATGRRSNTAGLGLEHVCIDIDDRGSVTVDTQGRTSASNIYAIGDVTRGMMLAHRAEDEGIAVAERLAGRPGIVNHALIPNVVYTDPEVAAVGKTELELLNHGIPFKKSHFPMLANSRAKANAATDGFVKLLAHAETGVVLGAHMVGEVAGTMVAQITQAMEFGATAQDVAYTCHAHPTHSEAIKEAALALDGAAIHY